VKLTGQLAAVGYSRMSAVSYTIYVV